MLASLPASARRHPMPQRPFRFLHASDLHLDAPCHTADELPNHLIDLLVDAPLLAAAKVFDAALDQRVDFVILSGDVINPQSAAPREFLFLVDQFHRLAQRNIPVFWSGGSIDSSDNWPSIFPGPAISIVFPSAASSAIGTKSPAPRSAKSSAAAIPRRNLSGHTISHPPVPISFPSPSPTPIGTPVHWAKFALATGPSAAHTTDPRRSIQIACPFCRQPARTLFHRSRPARLHYRLRRRKFPRSNQPTRLRPAALAHHAVGITANSRPRRSGKIYCATVPHSGSRLRRPRHSCSRGR